ncbi:hypothetical protein F5Y13DRAFT_189795 [Hypoxylon sp. FL1857]|nr:hypothetical protein F5Y13DRAFT_189795 [Hypoxylon sp. FL1857]
MSSLHDIRKLDCNTLGVNAPETTRWVSWETIKDELRNFLHQNPLAVSRVAHVEGPHGSGKSTAMLEYIWQEMQSLSPDTMVIYVPSFGPEATMLCAYFESQASPHQKLKQSTHIGLRRVVERKLHLATIAEAREAFRNDALYGMLPDRIALLMDLEQMPTADGELFLCELTQWHRLRRPSEVTIITMATFSRPPVHELLAVGLGLSASKCQHIKMRYEQGSHVPSPSRTLHMADMPLEVV